MNQPNLVSLNLLVVLVKNLDHTAAFYNKLGITFDRHRHGNGPEHLAAVLTGCVLEFYPTTSSAIQPIRFGVKAPNLDAAIPSFQDTPEAIISPPKPSPWGRRAVLQEPDGHKIELTE